MLTIEALEVLSALLDLGERGWAKKVARRILTFAPKSDLWTIVRAADILDTNKPNIASAKLDKFIRELANEQRADLVRFCRNTTGDRPRRAADKANTPPAPEALSVWFDTRPGYDEHAAQPAGLTVYPAPWEAIRARRLEALSRQLRIAKNQLPAHVRSEMRAISTTDPTRHRPAKTRARRKAEERTDDYMRTRLGIDDRSAPPNARRTVFDIDDDQPTEQRTDTYDLDHDHAAIPQQWATPCVWCFVERRPQDDRATGHDDGLCIECRDANRPGIRQRPHTARRRAAPVRTVAYLNPRDRAIAARSDEVTAPCGAVAEHLPPAAALVWIRAYYRTVPDTHRPIITRWVHDWRQARSPQPPTPTAPAVPVSAMAAA